MYFRASILKRSRLVNYVTLKKLYNLEEEAEIADKEKMELGNQKEVAEKEDVEEISSTREEKKRKRKI